MHLQKHRVFLGSSSESKWLAREIEGSLHGFDTIEVDAWYHFGSWSSGSSTLESLESRLRECDFAVLVLSDDDLTVSRSNSPVPAPRDNVVFELGLFMGRLGRDRAFFLFPATRDFKLPSDLYGITAFSYKLDDREKAQSFVSPTCTQIVKQIEKVARQHRARGMQVRPKLELRVRFPIDDRQSAQEHLSAVGVSIVKIRVSIDDDTVNELRVYFDPRLNVQKSSWTYAEDDRGRYFWASDAQLDNMRKGDGFLVFDFDHPRKGGHQIEVVGLVDEQPKYEKKYVIKVD